MELRPSAPIEQVLPDGEKVWWRSRLSPRGGAAAMALMRQAQRDGVTDFQTELEGAFGWAFMQTEIVDWTLRNGDGQKLPIDKEHLADLDWETRAFHLSDKATELYGDEALAPLVKRLRESSETGQTDDSSTSPTPISTGKKPRTDSTPSSPVASAASGR